MLRHETGLNDLQSVKTKVFNRLRYGLSDPETGRADHKAN